MRRREFITLLGGAALSPLAAHAQQTGKIWRIGVLETIPEGPNALNFAAFRRGLQDLGYVEGQNLVIDYRSADGRNERFAELARELVRLNVDVIVTRGTPAVLAAKSATASIPVVMAASGEPLQAGVIGGLARPAENVTGLSAFTVELVPKRLELMREAVPGLTRVALLNSLRNPVGQLQWDELESAARALATEPQLLDVRNPEDLEHAFDTAVAQRAEALIVGNDTALVANRRRVVELAAQHRLPAIYASREFVDDGGLMVFTVSYPDLYRRAATFVDKILKGSKPGDLPVEQPTTFELVINLKTANALGLTIPPTILARADEVIE